MVRTGKTNHQAETVTHATPLRVLRIAAVAMDVDAPAAVRRPGLLREFPSNLSLSIHSDLSSVEARWRSFEQVADCTAFQTFDWLSTWQRHIGQREGAVPVIAIGEFADGETAFIVPLAVEPGGLSRRLRWLGQDLCDYTAPLLAGNFSHRISAERFRAIWQDVQDRIQRDPRLRYDCIDLEKMPQFVGTQLNPFSYLEVAANPNGAYYTRLGDDWESFYAEKRSAATRGRDRGKRRQMAKFGEIRFVSGTDGDDARRMVETLMGQKRRSLAIKGVADIFAGPGRREFYLDIASNPKTQHLVHISRVEVGPVWSAVNVGIIFGDCYYHLLASYGDGKVSHYGPGALHLRELMAYAISRGLRRYDFTIGDEPYKLEWSDTRLELYDFTAAVTYRGWPACFWIKVRRRLKRFIKQTPLAWRLVCNLRSAIGVLRAGRAPDQRRFDNRPTAD